MKEIEEAEKQLSKKSKAKALKSEIDSLKDLYTKISFISQKVSSLKSGEHYNIGEKRLGHQQVISMHKYFKSRLDSLSHFNKAKKNKEQKDNITEVREKLSYYSEDLINFFKNADLGYVYDENCNKTNKKLKDELKLFFESRLGFFRKGLTKLLSIYNRVNNTQEASIKGKPYKITDLEWKYFKNVLEQNLKKTREDHLTVTEFSVIISKNRVEEANIPEDIKQMLNNEDVKATALKETNIINHTLECLKNAPK